MTMSFKESNLSEDTVNDTVDTSSVQEVASRLEDGAVETVTTEDENIETQIDKPKSEAANGLPALLANLKLLSDSSEERRYSHEFMELAAKLPTSKIKPQFNTKGWTPENIDHVFNLQKGPAIWPKGSSGSFRSLAPGGGTDSNTPWMKTSPIGPLGRKPYPGRSSDTTGARGGRIRNAGRGSMMKPPPIIGMPLPDVQLNTTQNARKPARKGALVEAPQKFSQQAESAANGAAAIGAQKAAVKARTLLSRNQLIAASEASPAVTVEEEGHPCQIAISSADNDDEKCEPAIGLTPPRMNPILPLSMTVPIKRTLHQSPMGSQLPKKLSKNNLLGQQVEFTLDALRGDELIAARDEIYDFLRKWDKD